MQSARKWPKGTCRRTRSIESPADPFARRCQRRREPRAPLLPQANTPLGAADHCLDVVRIRDQLRFLRRGKGVRRGELDRRGTRDLATTTRSVRVSSLADAILVSGPMAGAEPSVDAVREAKRGSGDETPVFANTGVKSTNVGDFLAVADGAIVGSDLKVDGGTWNPVDPERASRFMTAVRASR